LSPLQHLLSTGHGIGLGIESNNGGNWYELGYKKFNKQQGSMSAEEYREKIRVIE
jgi:hypothetical protein